MRERTSTTRATAAPATTTMSTVAVVSWTKSRTGAIRQAAVSSDSRPGVRCRATGGVGRSSSAIDGCSAAAPHSTAKASQPRSGSSP